MKGPVCAIVPMRAGSKGHTNKNLRLLCGKPLYLHTIDHARRAGIKSIFLTTDIPMLIKADLGANIEVWPRPSSLSSDTSSMASVLSYCLAHQLKSACTVVLLQATSPLRDPKDINRALELHAMGNHDVVLSVTRADSKVLKWGTLQENVFIPVSEPRFCFTNRAELPAVYRPDGAIYVFDADWFRDNGDFAAGRIGCIRTESSRSLDIDTLQDLKRAERVLESDQGN